MTKFSISIPSAGWFYLTVNDVEIDISYLCYPFHDMAKMFVNRIHYNIGGNVIFDCEEQGDIALHYSSESSTFFLKSLNRNRNISSIKASRHFIKKYVLPYVGIQSLWLLMGKNITEFSTVLSECDLGLPDKSNNLEYMQEIYSRYHSKKNSGCLKYALQAIYEIDSVLNNTWHIPTYIRKDNVSSSDIMMGLSNDLNSIESCLNPEWYNTHILNIRTLLSILCVDITNEFATTHMITSLVSGDWDKWLTHFNLMFGDDRKIILPKNKEIPIYMGISSIIQLLGVKSKNTANIGHYKKVIKEISQNVLSGTLINDDYVENKSVLGDIVIAGVEET